MQHTTEAIILRKVLYGEADLIVTFFGRAEGRLTGMAKSARISQRRFGGALELGSLVDLRYVHRRGADLVRIEDAHINVPTTGIMLSLDRIAALSRALELALAFLPERQAAPEKFDLLAAYISSLAQSDPTPSSVITFELNWLSLVGYKPALEQCLGCGGSPGEKGSWSFSVDHGGVLCHNCARVSPKRIELHGHTLHGMHRLAMGQEVALDKREGQAIQGILSTYVEHLLGRPLSGRIISQQF